MLGKIINSVQFSAKVDGTVGAGGAGGGGVGAGISGIGPIVNVWSGRVIFGRSCSKCWYPDLVAGAQAGEGACSPVLCTTASI